MTTVAWTGRHRAMWQRDAPMIATDRRLDLALFLFVIVLAAPVVQTLSAQQASRLALTASIWDRQTVRIDGYPVGIDRAERDGAVYSDKPPGQPVLAVPAYAVYRALGGEPASRLRVEGNLGLWAVSLWSSALPAALLTVLVRHAAGRVEASRSAATAVAVVTGTLVLPFSTLLFGHLLTATTLLASFLLLTASRSSPWAIALAGILAATSVTIEYQAAFAALVLAGLCAVRHRRGAAWFLAGAASPAALLALYNQVAFGGPLALSYRYRVFPDEAASRGIVYGEQSQLEIATRVLFDERGLLVATPLVAFGLVALALRLLRDGDRRPEVVTCLLVVGAFIALQMSWPNATGGASPGPRYALPGLVFLAPSIAYLWARVPLIGALCAAVGAGVMGAATFTQPIVPHDASGVLRYWFETLLAGDLTATIFTLRLGAWGHVPWLVAVGASAALLVSAHRRWSRDGGDQSAPARS